MKPQQPIGTSEPTPEQLLKLLDLQLTRDRGQRASRSRNRATFLVFGILLIVVLGGGALLVAEQMLRDLGSRGNPSAGMVGNPELQTNR